MDQDAMYNRQSSSNISQQFGDSLPGDADFCEELYVGNEDEIQQNIRSQLSQACSCKNTGQCADTIKDDALLPFQPEPVLEAWERHEIFLHGKRLITESKSPPPPLLSNNISDDVPQKTYTHSFPKILRFFKAVVHTGKFESYQYEGSFLELCLKEQRVDAIDALFWAGYFQVMQTWTRNTTSADTVLTVIGEQTDSVCKTAVKDFFREEASLNMLQRKARQGHVKAVKMLAERHPFMLETPSFRGYTSVYFAVASGVTDILDCLGRAGVSLTSRSYDGESVLHFALQCGYSDVIRHIVQQHNLQGELTAATLEKALSHRDGSTVQTLLELQPSLGTALMPRLVQCRDAAMLDTLVARFDINVNATDSAGRTGLLMACHNGDADIFLKLLSLGADMSLKDGQGRNVVFYSILSGNRNMLQIALTELESRGLSSLVNTQDRYLGRERLYLVTGLDNGIRGYHYIQVHRHLLHYFRERIKDGGSFDVSTCGNVIKSGWNNPTDEVKQEVMARYSPANVGEQSEPDMSPLHLAILCEQTAMAAMLVGRVASVRVRDCFQLTPAHYAAMLGCYDLLQQIVARDPAAARDLDGEGRGLEDIARANGHSIEQLLVAVPQLTPCRCAGQSCVLVDVARQLHATSADQGNSPTLTSLKEAILKHTMQQKVKTYTYGLGRLCCLIRDKMPATVQPQGVLDEKGFTLLHVAVLEGRVDAVEALLLTGWFSRMLPAKVNNARSQYHDMTALDIARKCRMDKMQRFLVQSQATEESMSVLHKLARIGDMGRVKEVLSKDPHRDLIRDTASDSSTVMKWAIVSGNVDLVKFLQSKGATLEKVADGETAVGVAVATRNPPMVRYVISKMKATINKPSKQTLPLMAAMQNEDWESFQILVTEGAELHARVVVVLAGKSDSATWQLVEPRVDVNCRDNSSGKTPLFAAVEGGNVEITKHLLKNPRCDIEVHDLRNRNLLFAAITSGDMEVFKLVMAALKKRKLVKTMVNEKDRYLGSERSFQVSGRDGGRIGYHHVEVHRVYLHIFRKLTTSGGACDVAKYGEIMSSGWGTITDEARRQIDARYKASNVTDQSDMTPLHYCLIREQEKMALELIKQGADIRAQDHFAARPSHYAAMRGYNDVLYELEKRGDTFGFPDDLHNSPIDVAEANKHTHTLNFFHGKKYINDPRHKKFKDDMGGVLRKIEEEELHRVRRQGRSPQSYIVDNLREGSSLINSYLYDLGTTSVAQPTS